MNTLTKAAIVATASLGAVAAVLGYAAYTRPTAPPAPIPNYGLENRALPETTDPTVLDEHEQYAKDIAEYRSQSAEGRAKLQEALEGLRAEPTAPATMPDGIEERVDTYLTLQEESYDNRAEASEWRAEVLKKREKWFSDEIDYLSTPYGEWQYVNQRKDEPHIYEATINGTTLADLVMVSGSKADLVVTVPKGTQGFVRIIDQKYMPSVTDVEHGQEEALRMRFEIPLDQRATIPTLYIENNGTWRSQSYLIIPPKEGL